MGVGYLKLTTAFKDLQSMDLWMIFQIGSYLSGTCICKAVPRLRTDPSKLKVSENFNLSLIFPSCFHQLRYYA